jgi:AcrR family transcriptional regulator
MVVWRVPGGPQVVAVNASDADKADPSDLRQSRRARILGAVAEIACEDRASALSVEQIVARSGVSHRAFNNLFANSQQCLEAAFDDAVTLARRRVLTAYGRPDNGGWAERIRAGLQALLAFLEGEPERARLCVVHATTDGAHMVMRCRAVVEEATHALEATGARASSREISPVLVKDAVGEAYGTIYRRLGEEGRTTLMDLLPPLTRMLLEPFLAPEPQVPHPSGTKAGARATDPKLADA